MKFNDESAQQIARTVTDIQRMPHDLTAPRMRRNMHQPANVRRAGIAYLYSSSTSATNPGDGFFRLNNALIASATRIYISDTAIGGVDISAWIEAITNDSFIHIDAGSACTMVAQVDGITDNTDWYTVDITYIAKGECATLGKASRYNLFLPLSAGGGGSYSGPFAVTDNGDDTVDISAGRVINGTTVATVSAAADEDVAGAEWLSLEIWYNSTWKTDYLASESYPTQGDKRDGDVDYPCFRRVIAEKVADTWTQRFNDSEIVNPNIAD